MIRQEDRQVLFHYLWSKIHRPRAIPEAPENACSLSNPRKSLIYHLSRGIGLESRPLNARDVEALIQVEKAAWGDAMAASRSMLESRLKTFGNGMIGAWAQGVLVGYVCVMRVNAKVLEGKFTWKEITDGGHIAATHDPGGDCLYGVNLSVLPSAPRCTAVYLLKRAGRLVIEEGLRGIYFGSRVPGYHRHASRMGIGEYMDATTEKGRILDPELALYRLVNCKPIRPLPKYFADPESLDYGVLVGCENPFYKLQADGFPFFVDDVVIRYS